MLVLSRKPNESIHVAGGIVVTVLSSSRGRVKLGVSAPADVAIHRSELAVTEAATPPARAAAETHNRPGHHHETRPVGATSAASVDRMLF